MNKKIAYIILTGLLVVGPFAHAQNTKGLPPYAPLEPIPGVSTYETGATNDFPNLISKIIPLLLTFGSMFAVVSLVWGGIVYMTSEVVNKKSWAISKIRSSLLGLLLLLMAYVFLNTINPQLVTFSSLANGPSGPATATTNATTDTQNPAGGGLSSVTDATSCGTNGGCFVELGGSCAYCSNSASYCAGSSKVVTGGTCFFGQ